VTEEITKTTDLTSLDDLKPKMKLRGVIKDTQLYGAIVDIGLEQDGLVHISQISPKRINRVTDAVQVGDEVTVWVTKVEPQRGRIGLSMVQPPDLTWNELKKGQTYTGTVTRIESYGVFVDIGAERPGLMHIREMSSGYVRHPSDLVKMGDELEVRVLKVDRRKHRIDLGMAEFEVEEDAFEDNDVATKTTMEIALERARNNRETEDDSSGSQKKSRRQGLQDLSEREEILARTLENRPKS
jgi:transcriptional accessory protein Tex/SPT6